MTEVLKIIHKLDREENVLSRNAADVGPEDLFVDLYLDIDVPHRGVGMTLLVGDRYEGHAIVLDKDEARLVGEQLLKYAGKGRRRYDLANLEDLRNRRDDLLLAVENTVAHLKVEEMEDEPDLDWVRRATSFVYQGKAILYRLEQIDKHERRKAYNEALVAREKNEHLRRSIQGQARTLQVKVRELGVLLRESRKEMTQLRHQLHNSTTQLAGSLAKVERMRKSGNRLFREQVALREHLGEEEFDRLVAPVRAELDAEDV